MISDNTWNSTISAMPTPRARAQRKRKPVRLRDIAQAAGVSIATVSMVIHDNPRISGPTRARVRRYISRMNYPVGGPVMSMGRPRGQVLTVLLPGLRHALGDSYFGELIGGITHRAADRGYTITLERATSRFVDERQHLAMFQNSNLAGVLCIGMNDEHAFLADLANQQAPAVVVDNSLDGVELDSVACDYRGGAQQAMNYLMQLGHRRIGLLTAAPSSVTARDVVCVYRSAMNSIGQEAIEDGGFTEEGGAGAAEALMRRYPDLTAIFAGNDKMAIGALHYLKRAGMKVPRDISVVGLDNLQHSAFTHPTLTTVNLPLHEVGMQACERLLERIEGRTHCVSDRLPTHLVVRNSTDMVASLPRGSSAA